MTHEERIARAILERFYAPNRPTPEQLAAAVRQVRRDREGSRILANNEAIPPGRDDLRLARSSGTYLGTPDADAPLTATNVQQLVDVVLDQAREQFPGVEFGITLSLMNALLLPKDADTFPADGGSLRGHVYRDCLVTEVPTEEPAPIDYLVAVVPVSGTSPDADRASALYGDLRSEQVYTAYSDIPEE